MNDIKILNENGRVGVKFTKNYGKSSGLSLEFVGEGDLSLEEISKIERTINNIFRNRSGVLAMESMVTYFKTMFRNVKEKGLSITLFDNRAFYDGKDEVSSVKYEDGDLVFYKRQFDKNSIGILNFEYDKERGISYSLLDKDILDLDYSDYKKVGEFASEELEKVHELKEKDDYLDIYFNYGERSLCEGYRLFYGENPDFSDYACRIKAQAMTMLFRTYDCINLARLEYGFSESKRLPYNDEFSDICFKLTPFGEIDSTLVSYDFREIDKRKLEEVGALIRSVIGIDKENEISNYKNLIFTIKSEDVLPWSCIGNANAVASHYNIKAEDASKCLELIKRIKGR